MNETDSGIYSPDASPVGTTDAAPAARRAAVVVNPTKQVTDDLRTTFTQQCHEAGWAEPLWLETTAEDPGAGQARQALADGADVVIAAGGDGTVRAVAGVLAGTDTALGLIPLGTGNLLARNLGIEVNDPSLAARQVLTGRERRIDVVRAVVDGQGAGEVFVVMAGLGFDAAIMAGTRDQLKDRVGWLAYVDAGLRNLPGRPVRARISADGQQVAVRRLRGVTAGNCGQLQGGFRMFPDAQPDDGVLDLMTVAPPGRLGWLAVLVSLLGRRKGGNAHGGGGAAARNNAASNNADSGNRERGAAIEYFRGRTVEVSLGRPQEVQLDGDHLGQGTRLTMTVEPDALAVLVPRN
jgi:diacylglycerol kinase family enzyme